MSLSAKTSVAGWCPEVELLLCCTRTCMNTEIAMRSKALLQENLNWTTLLQTAVRHRVMPLLYWQLNGLASEAMPHASLDLLRGRFHVNALHNCILMKALLTLLELLETHSVPAIPYKGPVLATAVYGNLALRQFNDLDILVHERDYRKVQQLLMTHGYRLIEEHEWEMSFVDHSGQIGVDLHRNIAPRTFPFALKFERLWERRQFLTLADTQVPMLSPEDLLLVHCVQIALDVCGQRLLLAKVCDLAELLREYPHLNWPQAWAEARRLGIQRILWFGLSLTRNLLGTQLSQDMAKGMPTHAMFHTLLEYARQQLFQVDVHTERSPETADHFHWAVRERLWDKVYPRLIPTVNDRALLPLPEWLSFLYYFLRPIRLVTHFPGTIAKFWALRNSALLTRDTNSTEISQEQSADNIRLTGQQIAHKQ